MFFKYGLIAFVALAAQMTSAALVAAPGLTTCGCSTTLTGPSLPPCLSGLVRPVVAGAVPEFVVPSAPIAPSVLYDNTVSNNLANVMQLLVVSNLLDGALPPPCGVLPPPCGVIPPPCGVIPPPCGVIPPPCGVLPPPCGVIPPPCGVLPPPCGLYRPVVGGCGTTVVY